LPAGLTGVLGEFSKGGEIDAIRNREGRLLDFPFLKPAINLGDIVMFKKYYSFFFLAVMITAVCGFATGSALGVTLNPTADASSQSGDCDTVSLSFSQWNHIFMKFDLSSVNPAVTSATLRLYYESSQALTISVHNASSDDWTECGTVPTQGSTQMASASASGPGWYEFDVTSYVGTEASGDDVITFCVTNSHDNWWSICAREGSNPPELVVEDSGGGGELPSPWVNGDVGSPSAAGNASYSGGTFTIEGDGSDIWGTSDQFHYVYQSLSGDGEIEARVASLENTNSWAKAGVMIREALTGGSTHAMMVVTAGNGTAFQRRTSTGGSSSHTAGSSVTAPYWVRLVRSGNTFTGYESSNGSSWNEVGSASISMGTDVYIGLAITSHSGGVLATTEVDNVTVSGGGPPPPPGQATNPNPGNGATGVSVNADLSWTAGSGATSHDVYFGQDSTPDSGEFQGNQTGTTFDPGTLANNTTYYWRIDEVGDGGTTTGTVWSFTTAPVPPPGQASNPTPSNGATGVNVNADLSWTAGSGATSHDVYFGQTTSPPFVQNQSGTTFDPGTLAENTTYYWRIDEVGDGGTTTGDTWSFTTATTGCTQDYCISTASSAPSIDGSVDAVWAEAATDSITNVINGSVSSDSDLSGTWRALWNGNNLYYLIEVTDDALNNDSTNPWDDDSIEIYIDADNSKGSSYDGVNDFQYIFRWNDGTIHLGSNSATNTTGIVFDMVAVSGGYNLEVSIPWSTLGVTPAGGNLIGTDVHVNDDDDGGGRDGKKAWFATADNSWSDPSLFATALLTGEAPPPPPGQATNPNPANGATSVSVSTDLSWSAGSGATSHDVYFGQDSTPDSGEFQGNQSGTTFDPGTLANDTTYYWRIDEVGDGGTSTGAVWSFTTEAAGGGPEGYTWCANEGETVVFTETVDVAYGADGYFNYMYGVTGSITFDNATFGDPIVGVVKDGYYKVVGGGGGTGLTGDYYDNIDFTAYTLSRTDATVNFDWGSGSPDPAIGVDTFSVQWTGQVQPMYSETYTFYTTSDDGIRLWVDDQLIIDNWTDHGPTENSGTIALSAGVKYDVAMDFYENGGGAVAELEWSSASQPREVIPQSQLYEAEPLPPGQAANPNPANGATGVNVNADLTWAAGSGATSHDVYFGQDSTPDSGEFQGNQTGTTFDPGTLAENTTYYWRIDEKNATGTTTGNVWSFTTSSGAPPTGMTVGCNFWRIEWGEGGWSHYFADGVNWSTTTNPWNPTFVAELQESKMKCLRFMDWVITNGSAVTSWSQRIPKTANHYYGDNTVPLLNSDGSSAGNGYGVAYEWQIDLCNRIGADMWVTVPHAANADYQTQLATLIYNNLNPNLKVYVEYSNECWNWGFYQTTYCDEQSTAVGIRDLDVGEYCEPWWKYKIYASVRLFERFESVFGAGSPRLVKAVGCQVGYNWGGYDYNHQIIGELACLNNSTINPNGTTVDVWAAAPYWGTSVGNIADMMYWAHNSLVGTGIKLMCYEGGSDNYSDPDGCTTVQEYPLQEQLYIDALNAIEPYCEGVFNQYCFVGDCWGLKRYTGQPASEAPKWSGALQWINARY